MANSSYHPVPASDAHSKEDNNHHDDLATARSIIPHKQLLGSSRLLPGGRKARACSYCIYAVIIVSVLLVILGSINPGFNPSYHFYFGGVNDGLEELLGKQTQPQEDGFTIMVPSFKRPQLIPSFLDAYATGEIPSLRRIIILWHDNTTQPEPKLIDSFAAYTVPVSLEFRDVSLNQRFKRSENVRTNCVLAIDDDMRYSKEDTEAGYQIWKQFGEGRNKMVGFIAREVTDRTYIWEKFKTYSIVLTKSAFFHTDWMDAYWSTDKQMTELREYVDDHRNCEDILISFLHARHTRVPPIYYPAAFKDEGLKGGISSTPGHVEHRTECVRHFLSVFGEDTLVSTNFRITKM